MSTKAKKSFVWLWMAALLTATVGVSVHRMYCYCMGSASYSVFVAPDDSCTLHKAAARLKSCCSQKEQAAPVCEKPAQSCCGASEKIAGKDHGCTEKTTKVFQLKTEFLVDKPFEKTFDFPLWLQDLPFFVRRMRPALCEAAIYFNKAPPPPAPTGWQICIDHRNFRC
ncbi:MAG: hypothetical protein U0U46_15240 [Saprospiraceae bacterium]|nr:hypothetical protein [Saprospiraceae bacterium]